jgi:AraC family transcriptional activator of tynA and feaB
MQISSWSTRDVEPRHCADYWRQVISEAVLGGSVNGMPGTGFVGSISARRLRDLAFASFDSSAHEIVRDRREIARDHGGAFLLSLQLGGTARLRQGDCEVVVQPGQMGLVDGAKPFVVSLSGAVRRMVAVLPRDLIGRYAPFLIRSRNAVPIVETEPCADLLREYIVRLSNPTFEVTEAVAEVLSENLCALLGVVAANQANLAAPPPSERRLRLQALLAFMRRHTTDPELTPQQAATHLKISVRSVHKLMQETGRSFCAWLLDERINQCIRAIRDPTLRHKRISEIAWSCGFSDVSYFNGVFKSRVGVTPSEMRASVEPRHSSLGCASVTPGQ